MRSRQGFDDHSTTARRRAPKNNLRRLSSESPHPVFQARVGTRLREGFRRYRPALDTSDIIFRNRLDRIVRDRV